MTSDEATQSSSDSGIKVLEKKPSRLFGRALWDRAIKESSLSGTAKLIAYTLADYIDWTTGKCTGPPAPSVQTLANDASKSAQTIRRGQKELERQGVLFMYRSKGGIKQTSLFRMDLSALARLKRNPSTVEGLQNDNAPIPENHRFHPKSDTLAKTVPNPSMVEREQDIRTSKTTATTAIHLEGGGGDLHVAKREEQLVSAGVSRKVAPTLARLPHLTDPAVSFILELARRRKPADPGAFITSMLNKPLDELRGFEPWERQHRPEVVNVQNRKYVHRSPLPEVSPMAKALAQERRQRERLARPNEPSITE